MIDLFVSFRQRLEAVRGNAHRCSPAGAIDLVRAAAALFPGCPVTYTAAIRDLLPLLVPALEAAGTPCRPAATLDDVLDCPVGLSTGAVAIAETGSVITADRDPVQRAAGMLSVSHLLFVPESGLVPGLDEAGVWLQAHADTLPYISFITGPSRSADIERTLTIGVQGPRDLTVILVRGDENDR